MKKTAFGGNLIYQTDSLLLNTGDGKIFESYNEDKKRLIQENLQKIGIEEHEQLYSISVTNSSELLREYLNLESEEFNKLIEYSTNTIGEDAINNLKQNKNSIRHLGAIKPNDNLITESRNIDHYKIVNPNNDIKVLYYMAGAKGIIDSNIQQISTYPSSRCDFSHFIQIGNQGPRGTCVAFAITSANEYAGLKSNFDRVKLSEQHLYFEAKQRDGNNDCGTTIRNAIQVIVEKGQCKSKFWAYNPTVDCNNHGSKPLMADYDANYHMAICLELKPNNVDTIKGMIVSDYFVPVSIPVYKSWFNSDEVNLSGRLTMPLPGENYEGGHAITLIGFQNDTNYPGNGYFLFRNSWGTGWAKNSPFEAGCGIIPFKYIEDYCWEAFAIACRIK